MSEPLADVLGRYLQQADCSTRRLSRLSGVPLRTIENWLNGRIHRPRTWQNIVQIAAALHLTDTEANLLLHAAGHPAIPELRQKGAANGDLHLLRHWAALPTPAPFQTIADLPYFTGRTALLQSIQAAVLAHKPGVIYSLQGMAGVGKTALAARLAYLLRPYFPDGVLWARVDVSNDMTILASFAAAYGEDVNGFTDVESRSRVVRNLLAAKRALLILDNVEQDEQVRPLLPPSCDCVVLLTTRRHNLAVTLGGQIFPISPFDDEDALLFFSQLLDKSRVQSQKMALHQLAAAVGRLPLAMSIVAGHLRSEPDQSVSDFLSAMQQRQLDLVYGDWNVQAAFDVTYHALPPLTRRVFNALGVFGGADFDTTAVAFIADSSPAETQDAMSTLAALSLVQTSHEQRYQIHPLLQSYARQQENGELPRRRMAAYYLELLLAHRVSPLIVQVEMGNVLAAMTTAVTHHFDDLIIQANNVYFNLLLVVGMRQEAATFLEAAQEIATAQQDWSALAHILTNKGTLLHRSGNVTVAEALFHQALSLAERAGDDFAKMQTLTNLGGTYYARGDFPAAARCWQEGLDVAQRINDRWRILNLSVNLGLAYHNLTDFSRALTLWREAVKLGREIPHLQALTAALANLGNLLVDLGNYTEGEACFQEGLEVAEKIQYQRVLGVLNGNWSQLASFKGDFALSRSFYQKGLPLVRREQDREALADFLIMGGEIEIEANNLTVADAWVTEGVQIAQEGKYRVRECRGLLAQAQLARLNGRFSLAETLLTQVTAVAQEINLPRYTAALHLEQGELALAMQEWDKAAAAFAQALAIMERLQIQHEIGHILFGQARLALSQGDKTQALEKGQHCLSIWQKIGHHRAAIASEWLATAIDP